MMAGGPSPLSMAITEFHFLLLFTDRLQVVSRLNGAVVQVRCSGRVLGLQGCFVEGWVAVYDNGKGCVKRVELLLVLMRGL